MPLTCSSISRGVRGRCLPHSQTIKEGGISVPFILSFGMNILVLFAIFIFIFTWEEIVLDSDNSPDVDSGPPRKEDSVNQTEL